MHTDYDLQLTSQPAALWCLGQNAAHGVATFHFPCLTDRWSRASPGPRPRLTRAPPTPHCLTGRAWTKAEVASALGSSAAMLDTATLYAGLLVLRRSPEAEAFLEEWLELTMRGALSPSAHPPCLASTPSCRRGARSR